MFDFTIEQLATLNNIVDDEIFRKSSRTGYESYIKDLEKLLIDIENAYEAKKANIEKTRKIAAEVEKEMEHPTGHGRPLRFEQIEEEWASDDSWMYGKDED